MTGELNHNKFLSDNLQQVAFFAPEITLEMKAEFSVGGYPQFPTQECTKNYIIIPIQISTDINHHTEKAIP